MYMYMYDILIRLLTPLSAASSPSCAQLARDVPGVAIEPLAWALAFGACFGGNGTLIGARFALPFYPPTHPLTYLLLCYAHGAGYSQCPEEGLSGLDRGGLPWVFTKSEGVRESAVVRA
jgi:hypothetical protein